jgi:hypothetical protein
VVADPVDVAVDAGTVIEVVEVVVDEGPMVVDGWSVAVVLVVTVAVSSPSPVVITTTAAARATTTAAVTPTTTRRDTRARLPGAPGAVSSFASLTQ